MKKLLALILVLTLVLSMGSLAFATPDPEPPELDAEDDWSPIKINKEIKLTNEGTINPAETFNFTVGAGKVLEGNATSAPAFSSGTFTIDLAQGVLTGSTNIALPNFQHVGIYQYEVKEVAGNTAGMTYDGNTYYLKVTVINDNDGGFIRVLTLVDGKDVKTDAFQNEFSAGDLTIKKEITGNYAVFTDEFDVTVTLTPDEGKNIKEGPITIIGAVDGVGDVSEPDTSGVVTITFKVTNNSEVTIANIPYDVSYVVTEDSGEYTHNLIEGNGTGKIAESTQTVEIVNNLDTQIETGINLDNLPYILILVGAAVGLVAFTMKRRLSDDR